MSQLNCGGLRAISTTQTCKRGCHSVFLVPILLSYKHDECPQATMVPPQLRYHPHPPSSLTPIFTFEQSHFSSLFHPSRPVQTASWKMSRLGSSLEAYSFSQSSAYL